MKRALLAIISVLCAASTVFAAEKIVVFNETARAYKRTPNAMDVSTGNTGLGTTAPTARLQIVAAGSGPGLAVRILNQTLADKTAFLDNGNIGLGTTAPTARLQIVAGGAGTGYALLLQNQTGAQKVVVLDNGNVGIGASSPTSALDITGNLTLGTHAQGAIFFDDGAHVARLTPGTSGNFLKTMGAGSDPVWSASDGKSNVVFSFGLGGGSHTADTIGVCVGDSLTAGNITKAAWGVANGAYNTFLTSQYKHLASVGSVTVWSRLWDSGGQPGALKCIIGSVNGNTTWAARSTPTWTSFTIDVSSLSAGTTYDVTLQLSSSPGYNNIILCDSIIGIAD